MSHAWIAVTHLDDEGYRQLLAAREGAETDNVASSGDEAGGGGR
jgi:hypothetical protein